MRELYELSLQERERLADRVTEVMETEFQISNNSIKTFWNMFETGQKMHEIARSKHEELPMELYKPDDWDQWNTQDREDYTTLINALPGKHLIPETTLAKMSIRVLSAAEQLCTQIQFQIAYEAEMRGLIDES